MNLMIEQINSLPVLLEQIFQPVEFAIREALTHETCLSLKRIYITGCGDSHHAALSSEFAFEALSGVPTEALTALQFSRYAAGFIPQTGPQTNLVIGISVSGTVSRTEEALELASQAGALSLAITASTASPVARSAKQTLLVQTPEKILPPGIVVPGIRTYFANQLALFLMAIRIGEVRGQLSNSRSNQLRQGIRALSKSAHNTISSCAPIAQNAVESWKDAQEYVFTGAGPNYATALFSAAKILEATGDSAIGQDIEEWAHLQYFAKTANTPTFIITAGDRDLSRAQEIAIATKTLGRRLAIIAPPDALSLKNQADIFFPVAPVKEMFSPLITCIPGELFAAYRSEMLREPYFRSFSAGRELSEDSGGISRIRTSERWDTWLNIH